MKKLRKNHKRKGITLLPDSRPKVCLLSSFGLIPMLSLPERSPERQSDFGSGPSSLRITSAAVYMSPQNKLVKKNNIFSLRGVKKVL